MKLFHISDLHLGRRLNDYSLFEDQEHILGEILKAADAERPDGVIIAGDIYDKSTPSESAVRLFDDFLSGLAERGLDTFIISGNHDSAERVAFGGRIMGRAGIYISPAYNGSLKFVEPAENVRVYLMPFIREINVQSVFPDEEINSMTDAARVVLKHTELDGSKINILAAHQFVTGKADGSDVERGEKQSRAVGGVDNIDVNVFGAFDYVALGHIHKPQKAGRETVRYCGSPLKYSFDETEQRKAITVVEIRGKDDITTREIPLVPLRELRVLEGTFAELMSMEECGDYVKIILTEAGISDARLKLSKKFPKLAELEFRLPETASLSSAKGIKALGEKTPLDIIKEFFTLQNGSAMSREQSDICAAILDEIEKEGR